MARVKTTYGKKPKATSSFAASTGFWSSPDAAAPDPKPAPASTVDDLASTLEGLDVREKEKVQQREKKKKEKRERALQPIDGNVASPAQTSESDKKKSTVVEAVKPAAVPRDDTTGVPKTPQRMKNLLARPKSSQPDETPQSERRRRRGKRNIPTICLDEDAIDENAINQSTVNKSAMEETKATFHPANQRRSRAMSTPERASAVPMPTTTTTTTTPAAAAEPSCRRRCKSPCVIITPKPTPDPLVAYTKPLLRLCADKKGRKRPTSFSLWAASLEPYFHIRKIAEASYGEVYRLSLKAAHPELSASDESVLKIIALKPPPENRPDPSKKKKKKSKKQHALEEKIEGMSSVEGVASEIRLLKRMAHVPGFTNFRDVRVLQGRPSQSFARAWSEWNEGREQDKMSIFPDPARKGSYDDDQLWAVIEMQDAGTDLENVSMNDVGGVFGVWDVFWSVALALAKGEEEARFEHRDLHMGNICIRPADANRPISAPTCVADVARNLGFTGLESTIIDYTLSRAQMTHPSASPDPDESEIAYLDLEEEPAIFEADAEEEYQYEIYRFMRSAMYLGDPLADLDEYWEEVEENGRSWMGFHPQTNLVWLHFILHQMIKQITPTKEKGGKKTAKEDRDTRGRRKIGSAVDAGEDESEQRALERLVADKRRKLEKTLKMVQALLDPEDWLNSGLFSAKDLVALALDEAWLDEEDVIAAPVHEEEGSLLDMVKDMKVHD